MPARKRGEPSTTSALHGGVKPYTRKKGEKYMNKKQLAHFRTMLSAWKADLLDELSRTVNQMRDEATLHSDPNDRASRETDISLELRSRDRESKLVKKIDEALERTESGDYGYCEVCGVEIGIERLEARPTAELCIDCKTLDEIREKQMA
jgi:DnaK suppressor protein